MSTKPVARKRKKSKSSKKYTVAPEKESDISSVQFYILKWIACITMTIDHTAYFFQHQCNIPADTYYEMRCVGRIACPLFVYLMVESFRYTDNRKKHLLRIGILAVVSELFFDVIYLDENGVITLAHQNICITLFIAYICLLVIDSSKISLEKFYEKQNIAKFGKVVNVCFKITVTGVFSIISRLVHADFGSSAVIFAVLVYFSSKIKRRNVLLAFAFIIFGLMNADVAYFMVIIPYVLICLFESYHRKNKEKKNNNAKTRFICSKFSRRLTSIYYPLHMFVLIVIRLIMSW